MRLVIAIALALLPAAAQELRRAPSLIIDLDEPGHLRAWLTLTVPVPESVERAFSDAMGCPPPAAQAGESRSIGAHAECPSHIRKDGLRWSAHWDLSGLGAELSRVGADTLDISIHSPRSAFAKVQPAAITQSGESGFTVSHRGELRLSDLHDVSLEAGIRDDQIWRVAAVAGVILALPLLLLPIRGKGPLLILAVTPALFCLAATIWLWATLPLNLMVVAPLPFNVIVMSAPLVGGAWVASRIAGGAQRQLFFWRGVRAAGFLTLIAGLFSGASWMFAWILCCGVIMVVSILRLRRRGGQRLQPVPEGELLTRVRELAVRAGTTVKSVQMIVGGEDLPAAFATRFRDVLLTGGLLRRLPRREVDAIICHELSHVRRPSIVAARGASFLMVVAVILAFLVPASLQWLPLLLPPAFLMYRANRRRMEYAADADGARWSGDAEALITGLVRVTRSLGMPLEWPGWIKPLMAHPSTMARVRALASGAGIAEGPFQQLLTDSAVPASDLYPVPIAAAPSGKVFTPDDRKRLNLRLSLVALAIPIAFGIAAPFTGYIAALLSGAVTACLLPEWMVMRTRARARALLAGRPGVFCGFSPSVETRIYDGSFDYDWGFAAFEGDRLVFRGDRSNWSVAGVEVERIWLSRGPFNYLPRPGVCFRLKRGNAFCLRPFDRSFGPAARTAATSLLGQATQWHTAAPAESAAAGDFDFSSVQGQPPPPYTWRSLLKGMPRYIAVTLLVQWAVLAAAPGPNWTNQASLLGPVAITLALAAFMAYPGVRRGKQLTAPPAPLHYTAGR